MQNKVELASRAAQQKRLDRLKRLNDAIAGRELPVFVKRAWKVLEPQTPLLWNWHHDLIAEHLEAVQLGQIRRLIINVQPRSMKSLMCTVSFPCWDWIKNPTDRFLFGSYADSLATSHSLLRRNLIESEWYQQNWGHVYQLSQDQNAKAVFTNDKTGEMRSFGILGSVTGKGGDCIVIDDPHNPKKAESQAERESTIMNFDLAWSTRLNNKKTGRIVVVMQRLNAEDLTGHLLKKNAGYVHLKIPTEAEQDERIVFPVSGNVRYRKAGDILHPERDGPEELAAAKKDLGAYGYAGQFQQTPTPRKGGIFQRAWFGNFYRELPARLNHRIQSWDFTFKDTSTADFVVGECWGKHDGMAYLIDEVRDIMDFPTSLQSFKNFSIKHPRAFRKLIEDKANGPAIMASVKNTIPGVIAVEPKGSKEERAAAASIFFEAGNVMLPHPDIAPWVLDYIEELCIFPRGAKDDRVDATSQALLDLYDPGANALSKMVTM